MTQPIGKQTLCCVTVSKTVQESEYQPFKTEITRERWVDNDSVDSVQSAMMEDCQKLLDDALFDRYGEIPDSD